MSDTNHQDDDIKEAVIEKNKRAVEYMERVRAIVIQAAKEGFSISISTEESALKTPSLDEKEVTPSASDDILRHATIGAIPFIQELPQKQPYAVEVYYTTPKPIRRKPLEIPE